MSAWVVDASVAVKWLVQEEGSEAAAALRGDELHAPDWILVECANVLWAKARRRELTWDEAEAGLDLLREAPLVLASGRELVGEALALARELAHPIYDCLYLALALGLDAPLVTADRRFVTAVRGSGLCGVPIRALGEREAAGQVMEGGSP